MTPAVGRMWAWVDEFGLVRNSAATDRLERTQADLATALYFPAVTDTDLIELISQFMAWAFLVDDEFDDGPAGHDRAHAEQAVARLCAVVDGNPPADPRPLEAALDDLWRRVRVGRSDGWRRAFVDDLTTWLWTYPVEAGHRADGWSPTVAEYLAHRRHSVGTLMFLHLCEIAVGADLPAHVRTLPAMIEIRNSIVEYVGLLNDLISLRKELVIGYSHNMVHVVRQTQRATLQEAVDRTGELATECLQRFQDAHRDLKAQLAAAGVDELLVETAAGCVESYSSVIRGNFDYHLLAERYTTAQGRLLNAS